MGKMGTHRRCTIAPAARLPGTPPRLWRGNGVAAHRPSGGRSGTPHCTQWVQVWASGVGVLPPCTACVPAQVEDIHFALLWIPACPCLAQSDGGPLGVVARSVTNGLLCVR
jgi:hypothetical protein